MSDSVDLSRVESWRVVGHFPRGDEHCIIQLKLQPLQSNVDNM